MAKKNLLKRIFHRHRKKPSGFTLLELLVTVMITSIVIMALLSFVVQLTQTDQQELGRSETARDMAMALDYIAEDIKEAVYVYDGQCLTGGRPASSPQGYCRGLANAFTFPGAANYTPVLALWKLEQLPYNPNNPENFCDNEVNDSYCNSVLTSRQSYTLVVYGMRRGTSNDNVTWQVARLTRYQLREFNNNGSSVHKATELSVMSPPKNDPVDGTERTFSSWPCNSDGDSCVAQNFTAPGREVTLVDYVDFYDAALPNSRDFNSTKDEIQPCPADYSPTPSTIANGLDNDAVTNTNNSFYACVRPPTGNQGQDVFVYLRGNAVKRSGMQGNTNYDGEQRETNENPNYPYLPAAQIQVQTRSAFNKTP